MYYAESQKLMRPWTPVEAAEADNACEINVWGRRYTVSSACLLSSMLSQNQELLASPMRIAATENRRDIVFSNAQCFLMDEVTPEAAAFCCAAESDNFVVNTTCRVEYDGYMAWTLSVMPRGYPVTVATGVAKAAERPYSLTRLWLDIPLKPECVPYFSFYPKAAYHADGAECVGGQLTNAGIIPHHLELPFCAQLYLSGEDSGFAFLCESEDRWEYDGYPVEILRNATETLLRIHLLDREPACWNGVPVEQRVAIPPVTFRFSMIATPVKSFPANPHAEHSVHIDCAHKIPADYEDFLFSSFVDTGEHTGLPALGSGVDMGEITFDRLERLGVKVLYLHEKWNTIQNSPCITRRSAERLRKIVGEAHRRDIRVIPYFGYEISTLAPYWGEYGIEFRTIEKGDTTPHWHWYRQPPQRALRVCYADPELRRLFVEGIRRMVEAFHFDGVYLDGTVYPEPCKNELHGCGWRDRDGTLHPTYPLSGIREVMKGLYAALDPMGCTINCHSAMVYNFAAVSFYHSIWDGECFQTPFLNGLIHELPDAYLRATIQPRSIGLPFYMLCYTNAPKWTFRRGLAISLLYGVIPKPNNTGTPLEEMSKLWHILDYIPIERAQWHPFYHNSSDVSVSDETVRVSYYEYQDVTGRVCRLLFCSSTRDTPSDAIIRFRETPVLFRHLFGRDVSVISDGLHISFDNFDCAVFYTET